MPSLPSLDLLKNQDFDTPLDPSTLKTAKDFRPYLLIFLFSASIAFFSFVTKLKIPIHSWSVWQQYALMVFWITTLAYYVSWVLFPYRLRRFNAQFNAARMAQVGRSSLGRRRRWAVIILASGIYLYYIFSGQGYSVLANLTIITQVINVAWIIMFVGGMLIMRNIRKRRQAE